MAAGMPLPPTSLSDSNRVMELVFSEALELELLAVAAVDVVEMAVAAEPVASVAHPSEPAPVARDIAVAAAVSDAFHSTFLVHFLLAQLVPTKEQSKGCPHALAYAPPHSSSLAPPYSHAHYPPYLTVRECCFHPLYPPQSFALAA